MTSLASAPFIPPGQGHHLARRFSFVCAGATLLTVANTLVRAGDGPLRFDIAAAYSFGISLLTWALIDIGRLVLRGPLHAQAPGYWPKSPAKAAALVLPGITLGYLGGTSLGDWVAGRSTFDLLVDNPARFYGILGASLLVSVAAIGYFIQRGKNEAMARQAQQARLDLLVSQLEPHMLFNTLANLRVLIARDPGLAQAMLDRLVGYLRTTLIASRATVHPLAAEFARSADYLALMGMRMGPRLQVQVDLPEALRDCAVPTLLLQPLVENAIAHGLEPSVRGGRIEITAVSPPNRAEIELRVRDTGVGLPDGQLPQRPTAGGTGYGLEHVRDRLQTLYGPRASLRIAAADDAEGGTVATIVLPKHHGDPANLH
ncbi:MAG: histidine kinase [Rubrivivax sp.]|nr:histidine kinase [Rubrivivax sp.]